MIRTFKKFLQDESGQTTTEYILILAVIVTIIMQFKNRLGTIIGKLFTTLDTESTNAAQDSSGQ
jgi:Flp pilus assembly pilin Flp